MLLDDDFGKQKLDEKIFKYCLGDENGLYEPELFRKLQSLLYFNAQNSNMDIDNTITRKQYHINRSVDDDPFALDVFVAALASVIGIGGDN